MKKYALPIIGIAVFAFAVYLGVMYGIAICFAFLSIIVSTFFASRSLTLTSKSLELTRNSIRPFLYTAGSIGVKRVGKYITLTFNIQNSGSLPGEDVHVDIDFFDEDEEVTEENLSNRHTPPTREPEFPLLFPNSVYNETFVLDLEQKNDLELWNNIGTGKTKCRLRIMYKSLGRRHITIQTEKIVKQEWEETLVTVPIPPQKWE